MPTLETGTVEPSEQIRAATKPDKLRPDPEFIKAFEPGVRLSGMSRMPDFYGEKRGLIPTTVIAIDDHRILPPPSLTPIKNLGNADVSKYWGYLSSAVMGAALQRIQISRDQWREKRVSEIEAEQMARPHGERTYDWESAAWREENGQFTKSVLGDRTYRTLTDFDPVSGKGLTDCDALWMQFKVDTTTDDSNEVRVEEVESVVAAVRALLFDSIEVVLSEPETLDLIHRTVETKMALDTGIVLKDQIAQAQWIRDQVETPEQRAHFIEVANALVRYLENSGDKDLADLDVEALSVEEAIKRHCIGLYQAQGADGRSKYKATRFHVGAIQPVEWDEFLQTMAHELAHHKQRKLDGALHDDSHDLHQSLLAAQYLERLRAIHIEPDGTIDASKVRAFITIDKLKDIYKRLGAVEGAKAVNAEASGRAAALAAVNAPVPAVAAVTERVPQRRATHLRSPRPMPGAKMVGAVVGAVRKWLSGE